MGGTDDWDGLEGVDAAERILRAALERGASQIHLTCDNGGVCVLFLASDQLEHFAHLSVACRERVRGYLKHLAGIDPVAHPPASGYGLAVLGERTVNVEVRTLAGALEEDLAVKLAPID